MASTTGLIDTTNFTSDQLDNLAKANGTYGQAPSSSNPSNSTPVIGADTVTTPVTPVTVPSAQPQNPVTVPAPQTPTGTTTDSNGNAIVPPPQDNSGDSTRQNIISQLLDENNTLGTEGDVRTQLNNSYQVDAKQQAAVAAFNQYNKFSLDSAKQINDLYGNPNVSTAQADQAAQSLGRQNSYQLANYSIAANAAQGLYSAALDTVQRLIDAKFAPLQQQITNNENFLTSYNNNLSDSQKIQMQGNIDIQKQTLQNFQTTMTAAYQAAVQNHAPATVLNAVLASTDTPSLLKALGQYGQVNDFSLTVDPSTGAPILFNAKTGEIQPATNNQYTPPDPSKVVNGYDLTTYATDPQYGTKIQDATSSIGQITDSQTAQTAISTSAPNSPITGSMIINAAQQYGVDPTMLASVLKVESNFGTTGVGAKTNNPGNVGNTDSGATQTFKSVQAGVNAVAQQLAKRKVDQTSSSQTTSNSTDIQSKIQAIKSLQASAPATYSGAINYMPSTGDGYMDISSVGDKYKTAALNYAKANNLKPITSAADVQAIKDIDTALSKIDTLQQQWNNVAPTDFTGRNRAAISNPFSQMFDTSYGQNLKQYQSNAAAALSTFNQIVDSKRLSNFSTTLSENSIPQLPHTRAFGLAPASGDTLADGNLKLDNLRSNLNSSLKSILPNASGSPLSTAQSSISAFSTVAPDGKTYNFKDQASLNAFKAKAGIK